MRTLIAALYIVVISLLSLSVNNVHAETGGSSARSAEGATVSDQSNEMDVVSSSSSSSSNPSSHFGGSHSQEEVNAVSALLMLGTSSSTSSSNSLSQQPKTMTYVIFDYDLADVVPSIVKAHKQLQLLGAGNIGDRRVNILIIKPNEGKPGYPVGLQNRYIPRLAILENSFAYYKNKFGLAKNKVASSDSSEMISPEDKFYSQFNIEKQSENNISNYEQSYRLNPPDILVYIGQTVDCGSTSQITRANFAGTGKGHQKKKLVNQDEVGGEKNTRLAAYFLDRLKWVTKHFRPDIVISENHTFSDEIVKKIKSIVTGSTGQEYYENIENIHHEVYSREKRKRKYLSLSNIEFPQGIPKTSSKGFNRKLKMAKTSQASLVEPLIDSKVELPKSLDGEQKLLKRILENFASVIGDSNSSSSSSYGDETVKLDFSRSPTTLWYKGKGYWLSFVVKHPELKRAKNAKSDEVRSGAFSTLDNGSYVVNFDGNTGEIDVRMNTPKGFRNNKWTFNYLGSNRVHTIFGNMKCGIPVWGGDSKDESRSLSVYEIARVHGCSKDYSKLIQDTLLLKTKRNSNFKEKSRFRFPCEYIGDVYSTSVLSRVISSIWYKYFNPLSEAEPFPTQDESKMKLDSSKLRANVAVYKKEGAKLVVGDSENTLILVDSNGDRLTPGFYWEKAGSNTQPSQSDRNEQIDSQTFGLVSDSHDARSSDEMSVEQNSSIAPLGTSSEASSSHSSSNDTYTSSRKRKRPVKSSLEPSIEENEKNIRGKDKKDTSADE